MNSFIMRTATGGNVHVVRDLFGAREKLRVRDDFVDEPDAQRFLRIEWLVGEQDLHRIDVAKLLGEQARARSIAEPALGQQRELEARMLGTGDADIGR
jgi:hypothetical protein